MCSITIRKVEKTDSAFLCELMNHPALMHRLHQTATTCEDWAEAIRLWAQDKDEQGFILCDSNLPIGWFGVNGLQSTEKKAYLKIAVLLPERDRQFFPFPVTDGFESGRVFVGWIVC